MLFEVGQRAVLKAVWNSGSADGLLADTSNHLGYVDEGAWWWRRKSERNLHNAYKASGAPVVMAIAIQGPEGSLSPGAPTWLGNHDSCVNDSLLKYSEGQEWSNPTFGAAHGHDERTVALVQFSKTGAACVVSDDWQLFQDQGLGTGVGRHCTYSYIKHTLPSIPQTSGTLDSSTYMNSLYLVGLGGKSIHIWMANQSASDSQIVKIFFRFLFFLQYCESIFHWDRKSVV